MLNDIRVSVGVLGIGLLDLILHDSHFGEEQLELIGICSNLRCVLPNLLDNRVTIKLHISGRLECHPHSVTKTMSNQLCKRRRDSLDSNAQDMRES
ncbi:hypothetical protein Y032_0537g3118 [Ancylostoma ceylanicum]|uniref:Uncharacterized protein n=1 Tax=Ancylostoma ceylanicum TaxID=53326 RepID=A0A016WRI7_9BILA|nr:hypothetical protein Y032_0537g3118 [Ancylostoma ceylanicum]